ncbi:hypothetical protein Landi51_09272 [Colletotrichum acutatum]
MSYVTNATNWLSDSITSQSKSLIAAFYELADSKHEDAGDRLATEVFSNEATFISPSGTFNGAAGFAATQSTVTSSKTELVLLGSVHMEFVNGKSLDSPFAVHIIIGSSTQALASPRINYMEVFSEEKRRDVTSFDTFVLYNGQKLTFLYSQLGGAYPGQNDWDLDAKGNKPSKSPGQSHVAAMSKQSIHV